MLKRIAIFWTAWVTVVVVGTLLATREAAPSIPPVKEVVMPPKTLKLP